MSAHTWYEACVTLTPKGEVTDSSPRTTMDSVRAAVAHFRELYPQAALIFVRMHFHKKGKCATKILHTLTVNNGMTAEERRKRAVDSALHEGRTAIMHITYGDLERAAGITDRAAFWRGRTEAEGRTELHALIAVKAVA